MSSNDNIKYLFDFLLIGGTLVSLIVLIGYARPLVIAPVEGFETSNSSVLFTFEKGEALLMDDNPEFSSPERIYAENEIIMDLNPGNYYWKVEGAIESQVRKLTINSRVGLTLREQGENYEVINSGNVDLDVIVYSNGSLVGINKISPSEKFNSTGDKFVGAQND